MLADKAVVSLVCMGGVRDTREAKQDESVQNVIGMNL